MYPLDIVVSSQNGCQVVDVAGEVDINSAAQLDAALAGGRLLKRPLVADLSDVGFFGAAGLHCLFAAHAQSPRWDAPLRIVPSSAVKLVVDLIQAQHLLTVYPSRRQALAGRAA